MKHQLIREVGGECGVESGCDAINLHVEGGASLGVVLGGGVMPELPAQAVTVTAITLMSTNARPDPITKTLYLPTLGLSPGAL